MADRLNTSLESRAKGEHTRASPCCVRPQYFNDRGFEICGIPTQHKRPCQRIGVCPYHGTERSAEPANVSLLKELEPEYVSRTRVPLSRRGARTSLLSMTEQV